MDYSGAVRRRRAVGLQASCRGPRRGRSKALDPNSSDCTTRLRAREATRSLFRKPFEQWPLTVLREDAPDLAPSVKDGGAEVRVEDSGRIGQRDFTLRSALAVLAGATTTISACDDGNPVAPSDNGGSATGSISGNHGPHGCAELTARDAVSLNIAGSAGHPHTVELSAAEVGQIADGMQVSKGSSSNDFHTHTVAFN